MFSKNVLSSSRAIRKLIANKTIAPKALACCSVSRPAFEYSHIFYRADTIYACGKVARYFSTNTDVAQLAMPSLSPTMTHGTISLWKASPGAELKAGDVLCEIETDKASVGFEMQEDCVLAKILVNAHGPEIAVGMPIALTVEDTAAYDAFLKMDPVSYKELEGCSASTKTSNDAASTESSPKPRSTAVVQKFMPSARHMMESQSLDTSTIVGTAKGGRISKGDLILAIKSGLIKTGSPKNQKDAASHHHEAKLTQSTSNNANVGFTQTVTQAPISTVNPHYKDIPNSNMRKVIAKRLTESKATVPHFYTSIECEVDNLMALRKTLKREMNLNISVNDFVIKAAALALRDVPEANSRWNKQNSAVDASTSGQVDISVAVATPNGLITPILTAADKRGLVDINNTVRDLAGRARDGKLKPEEYQGGSFSISNLGMYGISSFSAVINPPQACILAIGAGIPKVLPPLPSGDQKQPRVVTTVTVQLSADRRVADEAIVAQFLQVFQNYLSNPQTIML